MIKLEYINKVYRSNAGDVHALNDANLNIAKGENVVVVGKSGSGKSTLLNIISGIDRPTSGKLEVDGVDLNNLKENELALWRGKNVGIVFQFYQLLPTISALDNVVFAMSLVNKIPSSERHHKAKLHMEEVGLQDKMTKFPNELSGGERQRVAIARSLANNPALIIADEPTGNLDTKTGQQINDLFNRLNDGGTTIITVTHANIDKEDYDRIIYIEDGIISDYSKFLNQSQG
jgi:putative ABC transport system ATP-binding protein